MSTIRVLHIDDEPDIREVVAISLGLDPEFAVRGCASGEDGLAAAAEETPDIVLLDVMMPVMDGPTTLLHLRQNPRISNVPVIFMTARAQSREIEQFKSLGAAGVIAKPFDPMTLAASVRSHVRPAPDMLAVQRGVFLQRAGRDAEALQRCWAIWTGRTALPSALILPCVFARMRDLAHGLAGAGGIFGFHQVSDAAASLEEAVIGEPNHANPSAKVKQAFEHLLICITAILPGEIKQIRQPLDA
jgi:CheY-like chemotaxis protein